MVNYVTVIKLFILLIFISIVNLDYLDNDFTLNMESFSWWIIDSSNSSKVSTF